MSLPIVNLNDRQARVGSDLNIYGTKINNIQQELADGINELYDDILEINGVSTGLTTKLDKDGYVGTAQDLKDNIDLKEDKSNKGVANGYVPLNGSTLIDAQYLPSYVDDIIEGYYDSGIFYEDSGHTTPIVGTQGKVYVDITSGKANQYRWSGSAYVFLGTGNLATNTTDGLMSADDKVQVGKYRIYDTVSDMQADSSNITEGMTIQLLGYYTKNDGAGHFRKIEASDDGSGIQVGSLWANYIMENGFVNVDHFGAKGDKVFNNKDIVQKALYFIRNTQDISSFWYSDKVDSILLFQNGTYRIDGTVLTIGNVIIKGNGTNIISDNDSNTPVFETAYITGGVWISNSYLPVSTLLSDAVTNLKFENLTFRGVSYVFKLRGAIWQGFISKCAFYYCGIIATANNSFYFNYLDLMVYGTKGAEFDNVARFQLSEAVNRISFDRVSIAHISTVGAEYGTGISVEGGGGNLSVSNCSFEVMNTAIEFSDTFSNFTLESTYFENLFYILRDTDGAKKRSFHINVPSGYTVSWLVKGSGFRNTVIEAYQDSLEGQELYRGVVELTAGTNGNRGTKVYMDSSFNDTINMGKYLVTSDVELIPCDYQLEHGSNANGTYTKFPNGVLIQTISKVVNYVANTDLGIGLPIAFKDTNYSCTTSIVPTDNYDYDFATVPSAISYLTFRSTSTKHGNTLKIVAIGRWK